MNTQLIKHNAAVRSRKQYLGRLAIVVCCIQVNLLTNAAFAQSARDFLTSETPLVLLSANDAEAGSSFNRRPLGTIQDSITASKLSSYEPPVIRTGYGTVPNTIM